MFKERYGDAFRGDPEWREIEATGGLTYDWDTKSTYVQEPPYFEGMSTTPEPVTDVKDARILGLFGGILDTRVAILAVLFLHLLLVTEGGFEVGVHVNNVLSVVVVA